MVGEIEKLCQKQETEKLNGSKKKKKKTGFRFEPGNFTYKTKRLTSPTKGIRETHEKKF